MYGEVETAPDQAPQRLTAADFAGVPGDWVAGLRVVTGSGELIDCNQGLIKNATGYDLRHLFIASEGTLGFIVEADMRLTRAPEEQYVMVLGLSQFGAILKVLAHFQEAISLSAFEFFSELALQKVLAHRALQRPLEHAADFYALIEFDESALDTAGTAYEEVVAKGWVSDGVLSTLRIAPICGICSSLPREHSASL